MYNHLDPTQKLSQTVSGRVAIFIDAANLILSLRAKRFNNHTAESPDTLQVDFASFKNFFKLVCQLKEIRFYSARFEIEEHKRFLNFLKMSLGFTLITKNVKEYADHTSQHPHRKANFDVEIAVDTISRLESFDTYILFSGDCDFAYLLQHLRAKNKKVIVFSRRGNIAKELLAVTQVYFDIMKFQGIFLRPMTIKAKKPAQ